jgi:cyclomaltodextrinase
MNSIIVLHAASREYVCPTDRNRLKVKLLCASGQMIDCRIVFWNRFYEDEVKTEKMICVGRDAEFDHFMCELVFDEAVKYIKYYFVIRTADGGCRYLGWDGSGGEKPENAFEYLYTNENDIFHVPDWAKGAVMYQIFPERFYNGDPLNDPNGTVEWNSIPTRENFFGGDLKGILLKLDYLQDLGIDAIYLNPLFKAQSNHKYDTADYYSIDPSYGGTDEFIELVKECHDRNIKVILDGVFNHSGYYFEPFQDVLGKGEASKYKDWFFIESFPVQTDPPNYECVGYFKWMPKIRFDNPSVRKYFIEVGIYWLNIADIDGWRLDVADEVDFTFWQEFRRSIKSVRKDALLIGETWKDGRDMLRGDQMDSVMNYLLRDSIVGYFARESINTWQFDHLIQKMMFIYPDAVYPVLYNLIGSHDTARFLGLCGGSLQKMRLAVAFQMTFPGMPAIYYGDETGLDGENDPDCRKTMNWENYNEDLLQFYKRMIAIRKMSPSLMHGDFRSICCEESIYAYARHLGGETVYVVLNRGNCAKHVSIPLFEEYSAKTGLKSIINKAEYEQKQIQTGDCFYNSDINPYGSKFEMVLPAYHFEIIKAGGR